MSSRGRRTVSRAGYAQYIRSPQWAAVKRRYRESRLPQTCRVIVDTTTRARCGASAVDLHHRTYKNLGHEKLMDLVPLCRSHHDDVHRIHRSSRTMHLFGATKFVTSGKNQPLPRMEDRGLS